ncbi:aminotransferase class I/II-fold pyridoxal phosphate-dependent enzyme [Actinomyces sp. oral taxon 180]|uniref:aminotransferase class I/II-fold pyridoxal phosphate-dependent enzyme n=1 Tax=Actinomyces sp. oral taxon 180 TaxID=651609 RepID=UPI0001F143F1|nr:aminotransferase class I/II-fold pyridoxal phosphate-dependent enzyme [Actinomyces sp. oral taxon 180]EFU61153.1 cystathionine beta-lyase [Actinomyces sp. oral taxon 180 str. F0310]
MDSPDCHDLATLAIHIGCAPDPVTGDVVPPIHVASTYVQDRPGQLRDGYEYGRCANPTTNAFAGAIAALEGARNGFAFPSGMSAEDTLIRLLARPGDQVVHSTDVYGGTHKLLSVIKPAEGIASESVDLTDVDVAACAIRRARPQIVWVETPSNPFLTVTDIAAIAELTHEVGGLLVVDNTFATPVLQRPLDLGADAVVHSTTKYVAGHSDVVGGAFVLRDDLTLPAHVTPFFDEADAAAEAVKLQMTLGHVPSPRDTYLAHRGLKTLALRVERHCENAQRVAEYLAEHPKVTSVHYPGLASDPGHGIARRQNPRGVGGVLSFQVATEEAAIRLSTRTRLFTLAASLGAPESLIEHPAIMTHSTRAGGVGGVPGTLLRLAVGLEDAGDLIADLEQALAQI